MKIAKELVFYFLKLFLFWVLLFDFQRVLFSVHNWGKFNDFNYSDWFLSFIYSIPLDLSTASFLSILPLLFILVYIIYPSKVTFRIFTYLIIIEALICSFIQAGEINAYVEWNHKLTPRVFTHLSNPNEVFRTADYLMTFFFFFYTFLQMLFAWKIIFFFFKKKDIIIPQKIFFRVLKGVISFIFVGVFSFLLARGGTQQIPININSSSFSNNHIINDLCTNSTYYFANSYLIYNRSEIDNLIPVVDSTFANSVVEKLYNYSHDYDSKIFTIKYPNIVLVILESWAAEAVGCLSETKGATSNFDLLSEEGLLFTNIYSTGSTSEIGNISIFSGVPSIPQISFSSQPEKHRKLRALNQDFQELGYSSGYIFSGDLKYGNIEGYFLDHGFEDVIDERSFPSQLDRGKLNYYDESLYNLFFERINQSSEPFFQCAFTGSTHSPYDHPKDENFNWKGIESNFMNSLTYADRCIGDFMKKCKEKSWYDNTVFIFVADHGHASPNLQSPHETGFYRIPLLFWGKPLKEEFHGKKINKIGSQLDIARTLMNQIDDENSFYTWSKDLLNPNVSQFAFHTVIGGYGWVTEKGSMIYSLQSQKIINSTFPKEKEEEEINKGKAFLHKIYQYYKEL